MTLKKYPGKDSGYDEEIRTMMQDAVNDFKGI
jgi:hypothetical protein